MEEVLYYCTALCLISCLRTFIAATSTPESKTAVSSSQNDPDPATSQPAYLRSIEAATQLASKTFTTVSSTTRSISVKREGRDPYEATTTDEPSHWDWRRFSTLGHRESNPSSWRSGTQAVNSGPLCRPGVSPPPKHAWLRPGQLPVPRRAQRAFRWHGAQ